MRFTYVELFLSISLVLILLLWLLREVNYARRGGRPESTDANKVQQKTPETAELHNTAIETARSKTAHLATISHELRTPIVEVIGLSKLLNSTTLSERQQRYIDTIRHSSENLLGILDDVLDFSKIESGQLRFENINFDLNYVLNGVVELLKEKANSKGLELKTSMADDVPVTVCGDPGRLRQVLINLTNNAIKFTEVGSVEIIVSLKEQNQRNAIVHFAVRDTGIGIAKDAMTFLFQPFKQANASIARQYGGSGLGLSISKHLVENMGGEIGVDSTQGEGSEFWFTVTLEENEAQLHTSSQPLNITTSLTGLRALVIDENIGNRLQLKHQMEPWKMQIEEAESAEQAMRILSKANKKNPFNFVLMEAQLPDMDVYQFARIVKADEHIAQPDFVLLPSFTERGQGLLAREAGFAAYFPKPVLPTQLFECLINLANNTLAEEYEKDADIPLITRHLLKELKDKTPMQPSLLIVEDNRINQEVLRNMVGMLGFASDIASDGFEAISALDRKNYDLVLMDCQMPGLDGYEATKRIRAGAVDNPEIPIIAVTSSTFHGERDKCLSAGMSDYLVKPVDIDELRLALKKWKRTGNAARQAKKEVKEPAAEAEAIDVERLKRAAGSGSDNLQTFLEIYFEDMAENLGHLETAINNRKKKDIAYYAHSCVGMNAVCGINVLVSTLREIEGFNDRKEMDAVVKMLPRVKAEFEWVKSYLKAHFTEKL